MFEQKRDYSKLGLKVGLEIHQQLEGRKLFCSCPALISDAEPEFTVKRRLRAMAGESGKIDIAALAEQMKGLSFVYEGSSDYCCLVELDESPPEKINSEAIGIALQTSLMLSSTPVEQLRVMRKTVVDGSNTAGFQRTGLISIGGKIFTEEGKVRIQSVCIEEDAARNMREEGQKNKEENEAVWRLDRLGIPLIEVGTEPDIKTPAQAMECAEKIGMLLRSTGKVKRGLGTIRQDVNVSIAGGQRIEIKGCQALENVPILIENEISRQTGLIEIKKELEKRKITKEIIEKSRAVDITSLLANSQSKIVRSAIEKKGILLAIKLNGCSGLLGKQLQPNKRFGTELSERAKVAARVGGIFHSDELPNYGITQEEKEKIGKALGCRNVASKDKKDSDAENTGDAFVFVADKKEKAEKAIEAVQIRAIEAFSGVPKEVRKPNDDGTSSFMRPMPGSARMYPETDVPALEITKEMLSKIKIPELIEDKTIRYKKLGIADDLAELLAKSNQTAFFDRLEKQFGKLKPAYIAEILLGSAKTIKRQFNIEITPDNADFEILFDALNKEEISKESVLNILKETKDSKSVKEIISKYKSMSDSELEKEIKTIVNANKSMPFNALIGIVMAKLRGKASGSKISEILKRIAK